ncbi:MAG: glycogen synthase GlgA [Candidatus Aminicenantales bacterium]
MKVAFLASEAVPFAKTGGLADVAGSLPAYLARLGADVRLVMPLYREVRKKGLSLRKILDGHGMAFGQDRVSFSVWESTAGGFPVYFIENDGFFDRDSLYGLPSGDYPDNGERFGFFSKAALETLKAVDFPPRILHGHDWQSAPAFAFLKHVYNGEAFFRGTRSLFTIHNLAYQGLFNREILERIGLPDSLFNMNDLEFWGKVNFLKAGILYSTALNTVSPRYSREIQTPEFGCGLDGLLRTRSSVLYGLLNGVDYAAWNPESDPLLPRGFTASDLAGKTACRKELLKVFGLEAGPETAVIGIVSRLAGQKGLDIVHEALPALFELDLRLVILGTGETKIQDDLRAAARAYPSKLGLKIAFDEKIAHTVYAGSDAFLIPSKYEPCGLTQMYSLRYGAIPIVRATGGLDDSVREYDRSSGSGNGFKFERETPEALVAAVRNALSVFARPESWKALIRNAMAEDFSWVKAAGQYLDLYEKIASL